jgi:hypothetical protein
VPAKAAGQQKGELFIMSKLKGSGNVNPQLLGALVTVNEKYNTTHAVYNAMVGSTEWALATGVHQPAADLLKAADDMFANQSEISNLLQQLAAKRLTEAVLVQTWSAQVKSCQAAVRTYCAGSKVKCKALGWAPGAHNVRPPAIAPFDLLPRRSRASGTATLVWTCDGYRHPYQVQYCTDTANTATYSAPRTVGGRRFQLAGQTPGAILHFRALTLDPKLPTGQTEWSPWLAVTVTA